MKNIHVLPTDKPSRLGRFIDTNNLFLRTTDDIPRGENINIYITSDEEIKEGDWVIANGGIRFVTSINNYKSKTFTDDGTISKQTPSLYCHLKHYKKIILTTDQDLIKDGVQAIDDEFLEWFVKNSSCEFVKVQTMYFDKVFYKIIIPKEEPKQETLSGFEEGLNANSDWLEQNSNQAKQEDMITKIMQMDAKMAYDSLPKQELSTKLHIGEVVDDSYPKEFINKQETLEEVADRLYPYEVGYGVFDRNCEIDAERQRFIEGVEYQQERSYSEEDLKTAFKVGFSIGYGSDVHAIDEKNRTCNEWFEQFKKK